MTSEGRGLQFSRGQLSVPTFLPDATLGVVRSVDSSDLERCGIRGLVMNTFHLMQRPGSSTVKALGRLHEMSGWRGPIVTDSGGFQAYSLIRENPKYGHIDDRGITFSPEGAARKFQLTPEKTIQLQLGYGADVVICLDDCTHPDDAFEVQRTSVERTLAWAQRCKKTFEIITEQRGGEGKEKPLIFGVIQGGNYRELRKHCAIGLLEIGFDGFGFGGWPLDSERNLMVESITYTRELVPPQLPMHALGVGHPLYLVECFRLGYEIFDSALPTRDARHGRLYTLGEGRMSFPADWKEEWFSYLYINDKKHIKTAAPVMPSCDCLCCSRYSLGYLHHLFKIKDVLFQRLATIHNLRFMVLLTERLAHGDV